MVDAQLTICPNHFMTPVHAMPWTRRRPRSWEAAPGPGAIGVFEEVTRSVW
jgi:hypothetical protein